MYNISYQMVEDLTQQSENSFFGSEKCICKIDRKHGKV